MSRSIPALVKPALLIWARERTGLKLEAAAAKLNIETERLQQWEQGVTRPSIAQLRKISEIYKFPLAVFFLPHPPQGFDPQREFRRLPGIRPSTESSALRQALRTALFRREIVRDLCDRLGEPVPECKILAHPSDSEEDVSQRIRNALGITWEMQLGWSGPHIALNSWRAAIERQGVLVFQTGGVELTEMRGTSVTSGPWPLILLNTADAPHGRIFTLLHEFVHIMLTAAGYRTSRMEGQRLPEDQILERISNRFAAAILMPQREFTHEAANFPRVLLGDDNELKRFSQRVKLSPEAILRRLVSLHKISPSIYKKKRHDWQERPWYQESATSGGPPLEVRVVSSLGRPFTALVLEGYQRNAVSSSDVVDFLGAQLKYLDKIAQQLLPKPGFANHF